MKRPHIVARFGGVMRLNAIQVGKAIKDLGFEVIRRHSSRFWVVKERPAPDIGRFLPESDEFSETAESQEDNDSDKPF